MLTINLFIVSGSGVVGIIITVDEAINVSFTVEGVGDKLAEKLTVSLDKDDEVVSILLKTGVELGNN